MRRRRRRQHVGLVELKVRKKKTGSWGAHEWGRGPGVRVAALASVEVANVWLDQNAQLYLTRLAKRTSYPGDAA